MSVIPDFANGIVIEVITNLGGTSDVALIGTSGTIDFEDIGDSTVITVAANAAIYITAIRINAVAVSTVTTAPTFKIKTSDGDVTGLISALGVSANSDRFLFPVSGVAVRIDGPETLEVEVTTGAVATAFTGTISILGESVVI